MKLVRACRAYGLALPGVLLRRLAGRHLKLETLVVYCHDMHEQVVSLPQPLPVIAVMWIEDVDSVWFRRLCARYPAKDFATRLQRDQQGCYVALCEGAICGYAWVARKDLYVEEVAAAFPLASDEICIFDCFVESAVRGRGIFPLMLTSVLKDQGVRHGHLQRAYVAASSSNRASRRGIRKAGFLQVKSIHLLECRGRRLHWETCRAAVAPSQPIPTRR